MISEGASSRPATAATALRLVRNAALVCAGAAVFAAVVGVLIGHAGPGGALATGLAIGSIHGGVGAELYGPARSLPCHQFAAHHHPELDRDRDRPRLWCGQHLAGDPRTRYLSGGTRRSG